MLSLARASLRFGLLALALVVVFSLPAEATGIGKIKAIVISVLDGLGITSGGVYSPGGGSGWMDNGSTITASSADGVGIGAGAVAAAEILDVTGDATRKNVSITSGTSGSVDIQTTAGGLINLGTDSSVTVRAGLAGIHGQLLTLRGQDGGSNGAGGSVSVIAGAKNGTGDQGRVLLTDGSGGKFTWGTGSPESVLAAPIGSLFLRDDGGPGTALYGKLSGAGNTGWVTFAPITPTASATLTNGTWTSNTTYTCFANRVGDSWFAHVRIQTSGVPTTASLAFDLPSGMTFDTAKFSGQPYVGRGQTVNSGTNVQQAMVLNSSTATFLVFYQSAAGTVAAVTQAAPFAFNTGDEVYLEIGPVPITGW